MIRANHAQGEATQLLAVGITHKTAPIELRERFAFDERETKRLLEELCDGLLSEAMLISTCNRTELYAVPKRPEVTAEYLIDFLVSRRAMTKEVRREHFFRAFACGAVKHFFSVACAADSMILGEAQILGQVKDAYRLAAEAGATKTILNRLAHDAFNVAKRVKSETRFSEGAISVSYAAVELARKIFSDLSEKHVLLVGAGETAELAAKHLIEKNARRISITNRTLAKAEALASELGTSNVLTFDYFKERLHEFDIVIAAVGAIGEILSVADIERAMQRRRGAPTLLLDLGVPRNIDPKSASLYNVFLKDIDDLQGIVQKNLEARKAELPKVERIIVEGLIAFEQWQASLQLAPTIRALQEKLEAIKASELARLKPKVSDAEYKRLEQLADRLVGKFLHLPIKSLKSPAPTDESLESKLALLRELFALDERNAEK
ncbi:MAG: glutamyl-tRNA reductase [Chloroherpetonaceae bacterium]|nr:glutamyl-tRNA reductase [Chloroherpetonaceae bacterium]MDW8436995.1 glutamyl-tRNA reductase [Chloroherpetonaceae bacterium]